jgi:type I restriction enzyme R subunit
VAKDIMQHFLGRGFVGKAMVVSIDKATALRVHDKVRRHWAAETARVKDELAKGIKFKTKDAAEKISSLNARLKLLTETDMAVVVSGEQNEIEKMAKLGLDIVPHRKRMNEEALDEKFKDPRDPLRLVFVCAMWLTGFDAPSCSTVYLDKPMRNHSLMQTIARANRVFPGKHSGLIVDYANVFASLEKALAIYGQGRGGTTPVQDKKVILEELRRALLAATEFCGKNGVELKQIQKAQGMERLALFGDAVNQLMAPDARRKDFIEHVRVVGALYRAVLPDPVASSYSEVVILIESIAEDIRLRTGDGPADITSVMGKISRLLDTSVAADGFRI